MQNTLHREINLDQLEECLLPLMPEQLFEEFRANLCKAIAQRNLGGVMVTESQGKAIAGWLSDQVDILELVLGFYLVELERFVKGIELEDLSLRLSGPSARHQTPNQPDPIDR